MLSLEEDSDHCTTTVSQLTCVLYHYEPPSVDVEDVQYLVYFTYA
jgi:hypothetical protein